MHLKTMSFLLLNCLLFNLFSVLNCFNIDTKSPFIYENPSLASNNDFSLFGFSLALYPGGKTTSAGILIGAPLESSANGEKQGQAFHCPISKQCTKLNIKDNFVRNLNYSKSWIGASMDIDSNFDRFVICAPRKLEAAADKYSMKGACYWQHLDSIDRALKPLKPLKNRDSTITLSQVTYYYSALGQFGFSIHMTPNISEMIVGAPGIKNWEGYPIIYEDVEDIPSALRRFPTHPLRQLSYENNNKFDEFGGANLLDLKLDFFGFNGYSVASGKFYDRNQIDYVSGGPKLATGFTGQITIFNYDYLLHSRAIVLETKSGTQFGEYFGSCVAVGDINNDGLDDLLVGAPFYANGNTYNAGRVQIYLGNANQLQNPINDVIYGSAANGQFGASMQFVGDLNKDGFGDFAIAAPYELDNSGVVYIFSGNRLGLNVKASQRIVGREIYRDIRGFGISISKAVDIDSNGFLDFAVGAHFSQHAVVLRSSPIVKIFHSVQTYDKYIYYNTKSFDINVCFWFYTPLRQSSKISVKSFLTIEESYDQVERILGHQDLLDLYPNVKNCQNITIKLKANLTNIYDPIKIAVRHEFVPGNHKTGIAWISPNPSLASDDHFCPRCLVYDEKGSTGVLTYEIPFSLGCGSDNVCSSFLDFSQKISNLKQENEFVLGSSDAITLKTSVTNTGESSYVTQLIITRPELLTLKHIPRNCEESNVTTIKCSLKIKIAQNDSDTLELDFDTTNINNVNFLDFVEITTKIATSSKNTNREQSKSLKIKLVREADLKVTGQSGEKSYSFGSVTNGKPNFTQIIQVEKLGKSSIELIQLEIDIPQFIKIDQEMVNFTQIRPPVGHFAGQSINCHSNISYLTSDDNVAGEDVDFGNYEDKISRTKRMINGKSTNVQSMNKTSSYSIDCSNENVICSRILCTIGPFTSSKNIGLIQIRMQADVQSLLNKLQTKFEKFSFASNALLTVLDPPNFIQSGSEPDSARILSQFVGDDKAKNVNIWIIMGSVIAGVLLLLLLIGGLIKLGFFKREKKEELEKLKEEMHQQNSLEEDENPILD